MWPFFGSSTVICCGMDMVLRPSGLSLEGSQGNANYQSYFPLFICEIY